MIRIYIPKIRFAQSSRVCQNDQGSPWQRIFCWLFGCCPEDVRKGKYS